ncbi:hypothetical protein KAR48_10380 [bacterium]|nr:hypothetical protein [bacterium]
MPKSIGFFEDSLTRQFLPLTWTRPVFDLRCGIDRLFEKVLRAYCAEQVDFFCRPLVAAAWAESNYLSDVNPGSSDTKLWLNGRIIADSELAQQIPIEGGNVIYMADEHVAAVRCDVNVLRASMNEDGIVQVERLPESLSVEQVVVNMAEYPWDLIDLIGDEIHADIEVRKLHSIDTAPEGVFCIGRDNIYIDSTAFIGPGTVLDASNGPIWIGPDVDVASLTLLEGPLAIGAGGRIKAGSKIYGGVALGPVCKLGGEVEGCIVQGYSNKQHDGFLGHAFLGEWINLGANTNNSDLKNNYSTIKVVINGSMVDTQRQLLGLIMGDHAKSAISTRFNTGTVAGIFANIFTTGFPQKSIPSFAWLGERLKTTRLKEALAMAERVMARRDVIMTPLYRQMIIDIYNTVILAKETD